MSPNIGNEMVLEVVPDAKLSMSEKAAKSACGEAVPGSGSIER